MRQGVYFAQWSREICYLDHLTGLAAWVLAGTNHRGRHRHHPQNLLFFPKARFLCHLWGVSQHQLLLFRVLNSAPVVMVEFASFDVVEPELLNPNVLNG